MHYYPFYVYLYSVSLKAQTLCVQPLFYIIFPITVSGGGKRPNIEQDIPKLMDACLYIRQSRNLETDIHDQTFGMTLLVHPLHIQDGNTLGCTEISAAASKPQFQGPFQVLSTLHCCDVL